MTRGIVDLSDFQIYHNGGKEYPRGTLGMTTDGRSFRYALVGGVTIDANLLCQVAATDSTFGTVTVATTTLAADSSINVTDQSDTITEDELENGFLVCETDPGNTGPNCWMIAGNKAVTGTNDYRIYLAGGAPIGQVLTASSDTMFVHFSPWNKVIVYPTTKTGMAIGVTMLQLGTTNYGWLQTRGLGGCRHDNSGTAITVGEGLVADTTTPGNIENVTAGAQLQVVAQTITVQGQTDDDVLPVFLTIE